MAAATTGGVRIIPSMPATVPPTRVAMSTTAGCMCKDDPIAQEATAFWIAPLEMIKLSKMISAAVAPPDPKAMSTAMAPVSQAPTYGTNDKKK